MVANCAPIMWAIDSMAPVAPLDASVTRYVMVPGWLRTAVAAITMTAMTAMMAPTQRTDHTAAHR